MQPPTTSTFLGMETNQTNVNVAATTRTNSPPRPIQILPPTRIIKLLVKNRVLSIL